MPPSRSNDRMSVWEWLQTGLLAANLVWTTLCLGGYRAETMVVTASLTGTLIIVHLLSHAFAAVPRPHPAGWLLLPFLGYAAVNVLWVTPTPWLGWRDWFGWAQMVAVFWITLNGLASQASRRVLFGTLMGLGFIGVGLACYQHFVRPDWLMLGRTQADQFLSRSSGSFGIPNSLAAFLILLLPAMASLAWHAWERRMRVMWLIATVTFALGVVLTISRGAWLGLAAALAIWPLVAAGSTWRRRVGLALVAVAAIAIAVGSLYLLSPPIRDRLDHLRADSGEKTRPALWAAAWRLFTDHPILGSGAGSFDVLFERHRPIGFTLDPKWAHDDYLNTLSDYGAVGFLLFFGAVGVIVWRSRSGDSDAVYPDALESPSTVVALGIGVLAFALHLLVDFHLKIPALAMELAVIAGLIVKPRWPRPPEPVSPVARRVLLRAVLGVAAADVAVGTAFFAVPHYRAEAFRSHAHETLGHLTTLTPEVPAYRTDLTSARADLLHAVALDSGNAQAWSDSALATSLQPLLEPSRTAELGRETETLARHALALSPAVGEFWVWLATAQDMQGRWKDASDDYEQAIRRAPHSADVWYHYGYHLSVAPAHHDEALKAAEYCLRLDPENPNGQWLCQHLAIRPKAP